MFTTSKLIYQNSGDDVSTVTASNATLAVAIKKGTEKYIQVTSNGTVARTGIFPIGGTYTVVAGERYRIRVKAYKSSTNDVRLLIKVNGNDLDWPGVILPFSADSESWLEQIITVPTGGTTLQVGMVWATVALNEIFYFNELDITQLITTTPEYQYNLKDHLGNIRLTFTTKLDTDAATATLEAANANSEQSKFVRYANARLVNHYLFDHTNGSAPTTVAGGSQRLSGKTNEIYGLGRSLSVMPGDVINMEVWGKYIDSNSANRTAALNTLISQIATLTAPAGTVIDGGNFPHQSHQPLGL